MAEVLDAALSQFALHGYWGTSMADIARELGLGAPSLYNHVTSKGEMLREICMSSMAELLARQQAASSAGDAAAQLREMTEQQVRFAATKRRELIVTDRDFIHLEEPHRAEVLRLRKRYERGFREVIIAGRSSGLFHVDQPKLASYAIIEMGISVATWFRERGPLALDRVAAQYGTFALRMVGHDVERS